MYGPTGKRITNRNLPQTSILASTEPPRYIITIIITLGCPVNDFVMAENVCVYWSKYET